MSTDLLITFFPLIVALAAYPRGRQSEQAGRLSTLSLIFACCAVSAHIFVTRGGDSASPLLLLTNAACVILTLFFAARVVRLAGLRWYDALVLLYAAATAILTA
ncbi:MAG: hypothetical protein MK042_13040 [Cognatishimia sp.]|nr:hypothetical protein [Cognatishimia sp.]